MTNITSGIMMENDESSVISKMTESEKRGRGETAHNGCSDTILNVEF